MIFLSRPYRRICPDTEKTTINDNHDTPDDFDDWSTELSAKAAGYLLVIVNILLLCTSIAVYVAASHQCTEDSTAGITEYRGRTTIGDLVNEYRPHRFQLHYPFTPYRGPPSPAVDKAWEELTEDNFMIVSDTDLRGQNFSSRPALRGFNGEDHGVLAKFENLLWRHTWPDYYSEERAELKMSPAATHVHLDHCADLLRQTVQCNMDFTMITYYRNNDGIFGDFDTLHQCQNFDTAVEYLNSHRWSRDDAKDLY
ncbi:MAG: hypothetical protein LQ350_007152 [Teloschistes chrysophthalmus]|nr:MAG: hypothetical protein LQ350_007152 [Niorma chrysophthalma]